MTRLFEAAPFIIAEVGSNFRDLQDCLRSVLLAKTCGADAVKFQMFNSLALYGRHDVECGGLPDSYLPPLRRKCDRIGIEFMCTAFSPDLVAAVDPFVDVHKVASSDLNYPQLLKAVGKTDKPVLLSTGAASVWEIQQALTFLPGAVLMYCVASYPARTVDLRVMDVMMETFGAHVGFSDHSIDIIGHPVSASRRGATAIEKHFTAFPDLNTPDRPHSLTPDQFEIMVKSIRGQLRPAIRPTVEEVDMLNKHKRRLVATSDIEPGQLLRYGENFGAFRSLEDGRGLSPFLWGIIEGTPAVRAIKRGEGILNELGQG